MKVRIANRNNSLKKVSFTKLLQAEAGLALDGAKEITDRLLEMGVVDVVIGEEIALAEFSAKVENLGATVDSVSREGDRNSSVSEFVAMKS